MSPGAAVVLTFVAACAATAALAPPTVAALRRRQVVDDPNHRSSHTRVTVRGAGLAMVGPAAIVTLAVAGTDAVPLVVAAIVLATVGMADDLSPRPATVRLSAQVLVGVGLGAWVLDGQGVLLAVAAGLFCCGYVNAVNFMDGINGITGLHAVAAGVTFGLLGVVEDLPALAAGGGALAGAGLGFLPVNFPNARAFPGDVGSYFVGAWIAGLVALGLRSGLGVWAVGGVAVIYVADTAIVVLRRALRGEAITEAHRQHTYQRLVDAGHRHAPVALTVTGFTAATALVGALAMDRPMIAAVLPLLSVAYLALPTVVPGVVAAAPAPPEAVE